MASSRRELLRNGWGVAARRTRVVRDLWNTVVDVRADEGRFLLRLHSRDYHPRAELDSELAWLEALHADGLPVARPVRTTAGGWTFRAPDGRWATLLTWIGGRRAAKRLGPRTLYTLGALTARLHSHARAWRRPAGFVRPTWDARSLGRHFFAPHDERGWEVVPARHRPLFRDVLARLAETERGLGAEDFGLVHADLHGGNLIHSARGLSPVDFDDCGFAAFVYDLAVPLTGRDSESDEAAALLRGYASVRSNPDVCLETLDAAIAARAVAVALFVARFSLDHAPWRERAEAAIHHHAEQIRSSARLAP